MEPNQQTDTVLIDLLLKNVDLFVFCNDMVAKLAIAILQSLERRVKDPIRKARHHQNVVLQTIKSGVKAATDMFCSLGQFVPVF